MIPYASPTAAIMWWYSMRAEKQMKHLPACSRSVEIEDNLVGVYGEKYGAENVKDCGKEY